MGRFVVVVIVLLAIALLANKYLLGEGDPRPADPKTKAKVEAIEAKAEPEADVDRHAADKPAGAVAVTPAEVAAVVDAATKPAPKAGEPLVPVEEQAAADAVASAEVDTDLEPEPGIEARIVDESGDPQPSGQRPWDVYQELKSFEGAHAADIEDIDALKEKDEELYDEYMELKEASEKNPISESAARGGELFFSDKAGCTACHLGANFTDEKYHNLGVGMDQDEPDLGRFKESNRDADRGAFKTPTVRNVAMTAPYMHDGSLKTLEEVVEWYAKGGHPNEWLSEKVKKLELTDRDKEDLVAFMKEGLEGEVPDKK